MTGVHGTAAGGLVATEAARRLRTIIVADGLMAFGGAAFSLVAYLTVEPIAALLWNSVVVSIVAVAMLSGLRPLRRGRVLEALLRLSVANWVVAIAIAWVSAFAWPLALQAALLPVAVAASHVDRSRLTFFAATSLAVGVTVACLGLLQDVSGLSADAPTWLKNAVLLTAGPPLTFLVVLIALQSHGVLARALVSERVANDELEASRERVLRAGDAERRRVERDLHDGAQARLIGISLQLSAAHAHVGDPDAMAEALDRLSNEVRRAHRELRELSHGLYPTALTQHGITSAVQAAADRVPLDVTIDAPTMPRLSDSVEAAVYFCVLEALQNAARHSGAGAVCVRMRATAGHVTFEVIDDGSGLPPDLVEGRGFANMRDRLGALHGILDVDAGHDGGTRVFGSIPLRTAQRA